jgi:hypothetical protein
VVFEEEPQGLAGSVFVIDDEDARQVFHCGDRVLP